MNCDITDCMLSESRQAILKKQFKQLFPNTKQHALHRKDRLALLKCQKLFGRQNKYSEIVGYRESAVI